MAAGISTGCMAILSAQPTDVVKIRMQAEVRAPGQKSRYNGVLHAYTTIAKTEGIRGLYKGKKKLYHEYKYSNCTLLFFNVVHKNSPFFMSKNLLQCTTCYMLKDQKVKRQKLITEFSKKIRVSLNIIFHV